MASPQRNSLLQRLRKTGDFSDATVEASGVTFKVHTAIVCPQSDFFNKALLGRFMEGSSKHVTLDDPPALMHRLFDFLYEQDYPDSCSYDSCSYDSIDAEMTAGEGEGEDTDSEPAFVDDDEDVNLCQLHSSMYFLADKYLISGLKELCLEKFEECCLNDEIGVKSALEPDVVRQIFEESSESTKPLRNKLVMIICENATNAGLRAQIDAALDSSTTLGSLMAKGLMEKVSESPPSAYFESARAFVCNECPLSFKAHQELFQHTISKHEYCLCCQRGFASIATATKHSTLKHRPLHDWAPGLPAPAST